MQMRPYLYGYFSIREQESTTYCAREHYVLCGPLAETESDYWPYGSCVPQTFSTFLLRSDVWNTHSFSSRRKKSHVQTLDDVDVRRRMWRDGTTLCPITFDVARWHDSMSNHIRLQFNVQRQIGRGDVSSEKNIKKQGFAGHTHLYHSKVCRCYSV